MKYLNLKIIGAAWLVVGLSCSNSIEARRIRKDDRRNLGDRQTYLSEHFGFLFNGELPEEVEYLQFSLPWPVDVSMSNLKLLGFYQDHKRFKVKHTGVDIQVEVGTIVRASQGGKVVLVPRSEGGRNHYAVCIYSSDGLLWVYGHLDGDNLPDKLNRIKETSFVDKSNQLKFDYESKVTVEAGEEIGRVARWDFLHGNSIDHLHFEVFHGDRISSLYEFVNIRGNINPLLLLKQLKK